MAKKSQLPLRWTRVVVLFLLTVASLIASSRCVKMFQKHATAQQWLNQNAPPDVKITVQYNAIQTTTTLVFIASGFLTSLASNIALCILQDIYQFLPSSTKLSFFARHLPPSSSPRALCAQTVLLALAVVLLSVPQGFLTWSVFGNGAVGEARIVATTGEKVLDICLMGDGSECARIFYAITPWININAILPWTEVFFALIGAVLSCVAWRMRVRSLRLATDTSAAWDVSGDISGTVVGQEDADEKGERSDGEIEVTVSQCVNEVAVLPPV